MKVHQLFALCAVLEQGGFNRAAQALYLTQPAVSMSVRELERWFGEQLIDRSTNPPKFTPHGQEVYELARQIRDRLDELEMLRDRFNEVDQNRVAISYTVTMGASLLTAELTQFRQTHPNVRVVLQYSAPDEAIKSLLQGITDFALVLDSSPDTRFFAAKQWSDQLCVVVPGVESAHWEVAPASSQTPIIVPPEGPYLTRRIIDQVFQRQFGCPLISYLEIGNPEGIKQAVLTTGQPGILLRRTIEHELATGVFAEIPFPGFPHSCSHLLLHRQLRSLDPIDQELTAFLRSNYSVSQA